MQIGCNTASLIYTFNLAFNDTKSGSKTGQCLLYQFPRRDLRTSWSTRVTGRQVCSRNSYFENLTALTEGSGLGKAQQWKRRLTKHILKTCSVAKPSSESGLINPERHTEDSCHGKQEGETLITPPWIARLSTLGRVALYRTAFLMLREVQITISPGEAWHACNVTLQLFEDAIWLCRIYAKQCGWTFLQIVMYWVCSILCCFV